MPETFRDLRSSLLLQLKLKGPSCMHVRVSASHEMHPPVGASGSDAKQNCPSTTRPLEPGDAFASGTISLLSSTS